MSKLVLTFAAVILSGSFASAAETNGLHVAYSCHDKSAQRLTISMNANGSLDLIEAGLTLSLTPVEGTDDTFQAMVSCPPAPAGFFRCGAIQVFSLQLSAELVDKKISGQALYGGDEFTCRLNMM